MRSKLVYTLFCALFLTLTGCQSSYKDASAIDQMQKAAVYANLQYDRHQVLNVLLLPVGNPTNSSAVDKNRDGLALAILRDFSQFHHFHVQYLKDNAAAAQWVEKAVAGELDSNALAALSRRYHAQAVLLVDVAEYSAIPPMKMDLHATLFDGDSGERIWSYAHAFDSKNPDVVEGMRQWWNSRHLGNQTAAAFQPQAVHPSFFMAYVFHEMAQSYGDALDESARVIAKEQPLPSQAKVIR